MLTALLWGAASASSLLLGALLGVVRSWPERLVGAVLAFGGGALVASISFELAEEAFDRSGPLPLALGLGLGAVVYFVADRAVSGGFSGLHRHHAAGAPTRRRAAGGTALAMGAFLDGIPEQAVLGMGVAETGRVGAALLVAIWVSNLPESIGSAADMRAAGRTRGQVLLLWLGVAVVCSLATVVGYLVTDLVGQSGQGAVNGFAAGALLVMLVDTLVPEAREKTGPVAGLVTVLGFATAAGLSFLG